MPLGRTNQEQDRVDEQRQEQIISLLTQIVENTSATAVTGGAASQGGQGTGTALAGGKTRRAGERAEPQELGLLAKGAGALAATGAVTSAQGLFDKFRGIFGKTLPETGIDTVFNGTRNIQNFGTDANGFRAALNESRGSGTPAGQRVIDPIKRAGQRTAAITGLIARGGGTVSDEDRKALFDRFKLEEQRAEKEKFAVDRLTTQTLGSKETTSELGLALKAEADRVINALKTIFVGSG